MMKVGLAALAFLPFMANPKQGYISDPQKTISLQDSLGYTKIGDMSVEQLPVFGPMSTNVTVQREGTAFLHCPVKNPGDRPVSYPLISWVRIRDWHILTNGLVRFTNDDRFNILYKEGSFNWILQIKYTQDRDAGIYECQVSTSQGPISRRVQLNVIYPEAFIQGGEEYHVDNGSPISLTCVIDSTALEQPQYIFWYHNSRMVNYDTERGVQVTTVSGDARTESRLSISRAKEGDKGNYTCSPSNSAPATVQLFVTKKNSVSADPLKPHDISEGVYIEASRIFVILVIVISCST